MSAVLPPDTDQRPTDAEAAHDGGTTDGASARLDLAWDYAPAPESTDHLRLRDRYGLFRDQWHLNSVMRELKGLELPAPV